METRTRWHTMWTFITFIIIHNITRCNLPLTTNEPTKHVQILNTVLSLSTLFVRWTFVVRHLADGKKPTRGIVIPLWASGRTTEFRLATKGQWLQCRPCLALVRILVFPLYISSSLSSPFEWESSLDQSYLNCLLQGTSEVI